MPPCGTSIKIKNRNCLVRLDFSFFVWGLQPTVSGNCQVKYTRELDLDEPFTRSNWTDIALSPMVILTVSENFLKILKCQNFNVYFTRTLRKLQMDNREIGFKGITQMEAIV